MRVLGGIGIAALLLCALPVTDASAAPPGMRSGRKLSVHRSAAQIDNAGRVNVNNLDMFVTNHGSFGWDLGTSGPGLIYPAGTTKTALFAAGIWVGAQVNDTIRTCIAEYSQE